MGYTVEMVYRGGQSVQVGRVLTRKNDKTGRKVQIYSLDEGGRHNKAVITDYVGGLGVDIEREFKLKDNRTSSVGYNRRVDQWIRRNKIL